MQLNENRAKRVGKKVEMAQEISRRGFVTAGAGVLGLAGAALAGCSGASPQKASSASVSSGSADKSEPVEVRVASLKGPTTIGLAEFINRADLPGTEGGPSNTYTFTMSTAADEILPKLIKGDVDIALIPANAASVVYNKTKGDITCLDINTLGVLSVVTGDASVKQFADLAGRTVYLTGKGTTPEYVMNYLLDAAGIADSVTLEFKSEAAEVVSVLAADANAVGVLPQPFATAALVKNQALSSPIDLTDVWDAVQEADLARADKPSKLVTGVTVVRDEFLEANREAVWEFIAGQRSSVQYVGGNPGDAAALVVEQGIIDSEAVAAKAIPNCHIVCLTDAEMRDALSGYLEVLYDADPASVGGALPDDDFYYETQGA